MKVLSIRLPDVGEGVTEAELVAWHVKVGDIVKEDDVLAEVMTDKATVEIPSLYDGKVVACEGKVGDGIAIGADLIRIETDADADGSQVDTPAPVAVPTPKAEAAPISAPTPEPVAPMGSTLPPRTEGGPGLESGRAAGRGRG